VDVTSLLQKAKEYLPADKLALVEAAYEFALRAHEGQVRKSGEPYLEHPLQTAMMLADLQLDASTLAAALLHDVPEDCDISLDEIEAGLGPEVARLVAGVTKLGKVSWQSEGEAKATKERLASWEPQAENLRRMLIAMAEDIRVVFIKLADRLHNMRTLGALSPRKRRAIAKETLEIYAPLAHRLGMWEAKWQLEDLAFRYLEPRQYHRIAHLVATRRTQRESFITEAINIIKQELDKAGIRAEVSGRPKHIYSISGKMEKYTVQGKDFNDIHDLFALRVLVNTVSDCYNALGAIHGLWHPFPEEFNDFIANSKDNGYQSLHTTVMCCGVAPLEVQIRTYDMHRVAEYGVAAHWRYKEGRADDKYFADKIAWLRQLIQWQAQLSSEQFLESVKTDIFIDQVFVYTPKGEIKGLPKGATPLDFAFRIHTELGYRCIGAKVNGRLVPLSYELKNGDIVEIKASKGARAPSLDWLNPDLGCIKTSHAREKIRQWFRKQERAVNIERGKQLLEKELKRLGIGLANPEEAMRPFNYGSLDDFFASLGYGGITPRQVVLKLAADSEQLQAPAEITPSRKTAVSGVEVLGVGNLLTQLASCCHPLPDDEIIGYITRSHGITVHRKDCPNIVGKVEKERLIEVSWGHFKQVYPVDIQVDAWDRVGLIRDISAVIAGEKINIDSISTTEHDDHTMSVFVTLEIKGVAQLTQLLSKLYAVQGVISASRRGEDKACFGSKS